MLRKLMEIFMTSNSLHQRGIGMTVGSTDGHSASKLPTDESVIPDTIQATTRRKSFCNFHIIENHALC